MFANKEVATRHLPVAVAVAVPPVAVARGLDAKASKADSARDRHLAVRRSSDPRLQATRVSPRVVERKRDDSDPYADVPCTD
jgi:hypothetical protein